MSYYQKHLFICTNQKTNGAKCCHQAGAEAAFERARANLIAAKQLGQGLHGVSKSGCMGRCGQGPTTVVYPQATWHTYQNLEDIDTITNAMINDTLLDNEVLKPLLMPAPKPRPALS